MAKFWLFRVAAAVLPVLPMWLLTPLFRLASLVAWVFAGTTRRRVRANLAHVPALADSPARLRRATRGVFAHTFLNYLDFFRGRTLSDAEVAANWQIDGLDLFDEMMARGKGLIVMGAHYGNFERGSSRLGALGYDVYTPAEHLKPERLYEIFCDIRQHHRMHLLDADKRETLRTMLDALKRNEIVMVLSDRYVVGGSEEVSLFGAPARMPTAAPSIAARTGAPTVAIFSWRDRGGIPRATFIPLDDEMVTWARTHRTSAWVLADDGRAVSTEVAAVATKETTAQVAQRILRRFATAVERMVSEHPDQWVSAMSPIWDDDVAATRD